MYENKQDWTDKTGNQEEKDKDLSLNACDNG